MTVLRHYLISDDLDDLEILEQELERQEVQTEQIHVLSLDDAATEAHPHIHDVSSLMKRDVIHSGKRGLAIGVVGAVLVLLVAWLMAWTNIGAGWIPFIFLAIIVVGFCTWAGGFLGIQKENYHFARFHDDLEQGNHVFFVDLLSEQEGILDELVKHHPRLRDAGTERGTPSWIMKGQSIIPHFLQETLP